MPVEPVDEVLYNPLDPAFLRDPYPALHRLRAVDPVHWSPYAYCWVLTRFDDVRMVLTDRRFGIALDWLMQIEALKPTFAEPYNRIIRTQILAADPPHHTRIRGILAKFFTAPAVEAKRAEVQRVVDGFVDRVLARGRMDYMADFACPIPATIMSDMLRLPDEDRPRLWQWAHAMMATTDPRPMTPERTDAANEAALGFERYFHEHAARCRRKRIDGPFQAMVDALDGGVVDNEEFVANLILLFTAGIDTSVNLLGNGMLALQRHPRQVELLREDPSLVKGAVDELLRYDTTLQIARRTALEDVDIGGKRVPRGSYIVCMLSAANRDPSVFPDPDRLDVTRRGARPFSFGGGIHYCLGAGLARLEAEIVVATVLRRIPGLRVDEGEPQWTANAFLRGLSVLPASWPVPT